MVEFLGTRFLCAAISNPLSHPEKAGLTLSNNEGVSRKLLVSAPGRFLSVSIKRCRSVRLNEAVWGFSSSLTDLRSCQASISAYYYL